MIDCGHIKTKSSQSPSLRLRLIRNFLEGVYLRHNDVDYVVREAVVFNRRNTKTVEVLCHVAGLCIEVCTNHEVQKMNPSVAKRLVTGSKKVIRNNEKAEKKRVEEAVRQILKLPSSFSFGSNDESDACCVALAFAIQGGDLAGV